MQVPKIMLVDDEHLVLRSLEKTLLRAGFFVETAQDAKSGLNLFKTAQENNEPFDIAFLDLNMPNFDDQPDPNAGLDLLSKLLELDPDLPIVVLTAFDEVSRAKEAVDRGAQSYFVKGHEAELIKIVNNIVS